MKFSELIKTTKIKIPHTDLVVEIKTELSWFEQLECVKIKDELERGKYLFLKLIVDWDLTDEDNKQMLITEEVIRKLPSSIVLPTLKEITKIAQIKILKKND